MSPPSVAPLNDTTVESERETATAQGSTGKVNSCEQFLRPSYDPTLHSQGSPQERTNSQQNLYGRNMNGSNRIRLLRARATDHAVQAEALATKAVGYIRVSTEEQATNGHGLEVQDRAIRSFAESQGYTLIDVVSDPGVSGAKRPEDRPGFQRIIELAKARKFSVLLLWKFDRLARNLLFSVTTVDDLKEQYGVVLRSVTEPIDTASPMGGIIPIDSRMDYSATFCRSFSNRTAKSVLLLRRVHY